MKDRILQLDKSIQEYISLGIKSGLFNKNNLNRIITRLERVKFSIDNNNPGDAQTEPIRDSSNFRISYGINVKINENKTNNTGKFYYRDEVVFHELTHSVNGIYENWFENLSLWFDFDKKFKETFIVKEDTIEELSNNPKYRQKGYSWQVLDEFVDQYVSQKLVETKYGTKVYPIEKKPIRQSDPIIYINTNFNDYYEYYDLVMKFIEPIYGSNVNQFIIDSLDDTAINKIFNYYKNRSLGFDELYSLLGVMGNIGFAVGSRNFSEAQKASDSDMLARNPKNFYKNYNECFSILNNVLENKISIPGVKGSFGSSNF